MSPVSSDQERASTTPRCETCGNDYDKPIEIIVGGKRHFFDSFECALHKLAPTCSHCGCRIIGHGAEAEGRFYCCAHCARHAGFTEATDRPDGESPSAGPGTG